MLGWPGIQEGLQTKFSQALPPTCSRIRVDGIGLHCVRMECNCSCCISLESKNYFHLFTLFIPWPRTAPTPILGTDSKTGKRGLTGELVAVHGFDPSLNGRRMPKVVDYSQREG